MLSKPKIILVGGGGHCKSCIEVIESEGKYIIMGILDVAQNVGKNILGYPMIGTDDVIPSMVNKKYSFLVTVGLIKNAETRIRIYNDLRLLNANLPVIISPTGIVSKHTTLFEGTIVMHQAVINAGSTIGTNCIINTKSLIEHDSVVGANTHISTNTIVNGECKIGENCFIGSGVVINQGVTIANEVIIGSGAVVTKNIEESGTYVGVPAKRFK